MMQVEVDSLQPSLASQAVLKGSSMRNFIILAALLTITTGCATQKQWAATGGSRSDGVVRLSYEYGPFESPQVDEAAGLALAKQRCAVWGYTGAEAFGGVTQQCNAWTTSGCMGFLVTKEYQCTGNGGAAIGMAQSVTLPMPMLAR